METTINVSELTLMNVNANLFFNYLALTLDNADKFEIGDFYDLLINIKNGKYKNILADFMLCKRTSILINLCYYLFNNVKNNNLTIIYDYDKILININYRGCIISLIITDFNEKYSILNFINDYLEYEAESLNND